MDTLVQKLRARAGHCRHSQKIPIPVEENPSPPSHCFQVFGYEFLIQSVLR